MAKINKDDLKIGVTFTSCKECDRVEVIYGHWEWFEEWSPSTPEHPRECEDCGWRCSRCKSTLSDMVGGYWDNVFEEPKLNYCPNCGSRMKLYHYDDIKYEF